MKKKVLYRSLGILFILIGSIGFLGVFNNHVGYSIFDKKILNETNKSLDIEINEIVSNAGIERNLSVRVVNFGEIFLNDCELIFPESFWFYSLEKKGISPGEKTEFNFKLVVPDEIEPKKYLQKLVVSCFEENYSEYFNLSISKNIFNIGEINPKKGGLVINYFFDKSDFIGEKVVSEIRIFKNEQKIAIKDDVFSIRKEGFIDREVFVEIPNLEKGIYSVYILLKDSEDYIVKKNFVLNKGLTGNVILKGETSSIIAYIIFLLIIFIGAFFIFWSGREERFKNKKLLEKRVSY